MRTKTEKIGLAVIVVLLFCILNFYGFRWLSKQQAVLKTSEAEMKADQAEARVLLAQANVWAQRQEWIKANQPTMGDEGDTKATVLDYVVKSARDNKLEILDQNPNESQKGPAGTRINVTVKVKGSTQDLVKFLAPLEKPKDFYAVSITDLKADQDQKSMICSIQVARYFKEKGQ